MSEEPENGRGNERSVFGLLARAPGGSESIMKLHSNARTLALATAVALGPAAAHAQTGQFFIFGSMVTDYGLALNVNINFTGGVDPTSVCGTDASCLDRQSTVYIDLHASAIATATCLPPGQGTGNGKNHQVTAPRPDRCRLGRGDRRISSPGATRRNHRRRAYHTPADEPHDCRGARLPQPKLVRDVHPISPLRTRRSASPRARRRSPAGSWCAASIHRRRTAR